MENLILALDCSLRLTNVAVLSGGDVLISESLDIGRRQAAELPSVVKRALDGCKRTFAHVGLIAVTNGPGYFTGIRIGVSYAAALAYGLGVKVAPVSTLLTLALSGRQERERNRPVLAVVYAGLGRVYAESFGCKDDLPAGEYGKDHLAAWLSGHDAEVVSDDPGKTFLPELRPAPCAFRKVRPDAAEAAYIAWRAPDSAVSPMALRVSYHRGI